MISSHTSHRNSIENECNAIEMHSLIIWFSEVFPVFALFTLKVGLCVPSLLVGLSRVEN